MFKSKKSLLIAAIVFCAVGLVGMAKSASASTDYDAWLLCYGKKAEGDCVKADFDGNGLVWIQDFNLFKIAIAKYDLNGDGVISLATSTPTDFQPFYNCWLKTSADANWADYKKADFDADNVVGFKDFNDIKAAVSKYDLNGDGVVNTSSNEIKPIFRIMTQSDSGDYIGQNKSWDFSISNNSKITVTGAAANNVAFKTENFSVSYMSFGFASETGKTLSPGLYTPAKRLPFRGSFNGIDISGDGRGCNTILGAFYVHEYVLNNGTLEKAAIDFVQICEPSTSDLQTDTRPKLYGSLRYNSSVPDSCNSQGCAEAAKNVGVISKPDLTISDASFAPNNPVQNQAFNGNLNVTIKNIGSAPTNNTEGIRINASITKSNGALVNWSGSDSLKYISNLNANSSGIASLPLNNINFDTSSITVKVWVDNAEQGGSGFINESNENNNTLTKTITIAGMETKSDLIIKNIMAIPAEVGIKGVRVRYSNVGQTLPRASFKIKLKDGSSSYSSEAIDNWPADFMAGEERNKDFPLDDGTYNLTATIDSDYIINESNENNNTLTKTITIAGMEVKPDLVFRENSFKYYVSDGTQVGWPVVGLPLVYVEVEDKNKIYNSEYGGWTMTVKSGDKSNVYAQSVVSDYVRSYTINLIGVGINTDNKEHNLVLTVDPHNMLNEANENNNTLTKTITAYSQNQDKPDLKILDVKRRVGQGLVEGINYNIIAFTVHYKNNSNIEINKPFYISVKTQGTPDYPDGFMASKLIEKVIKPHENYSETINGVYLSSIKNTDKIETVVSAGVDVVYEDKNDPNYWINNNNKIDESNENNNTLEKKMIINENDDPIQTIRDRAKDLFENKFEAMRAEIKELRDIIKEQQTQIKYLVSLKKDVKALSEKVESAINNFITYGVDDNTKKLGAGERAAVMYSFKAAFNKLPETEEELADAIKIANGRFPSITNDQAEKEAKDQFIKIYKRIADMNNANDSAAIKVMAYGLRQKAENRNLNSEKSGINSFKGIYGYTPKSTEDWNTMQAITYSGAKRMPDADKDLLSDEMEKRLGTNPNKADTDGDGHKDGTEVNGGFDPLKK